MLTRQQRRELSAAAHHLEPLVRIGKARCTPGVTGAVEQNLAAHELIKVKVLAGERGEIDTFGEQLAAGSGADLVRRTGKVLMLYRFRPENSQYGIDNRKTDRDPSSVSSDPGNSPAAHRISGTDH